LTHFRSRPGRHGEREDAEDEGEGGHENRTKARPGGGRRSLLGLIAVHVLPLPGEFDDQDRVLRGQANEDHEADLGEDVDRHAPEGQAGGRG
jgi:hypothetical protein